ncbi:unnamed protein product, partial [Musa hybrid cultivar]
QWFTSRTGTSSWRDRCNFSARIPTRHCDGKLILKVIDNRECLKFRTDQAQNARKMEKLNNIFFTLMLTYQKHQARNRLSNQHPRKEGEGG